MLIYENIQELDTFESFYSTPFMGNGNLIIPFINIGVSLHPINPNKSPLYLDKSYLVFFDADIIAENGRYTRYCDPPKQTVTIGGISVSKLQHVELKLCFSSAFLQILPDTKKANTFGYQLLLQIYL